MDNNQSAAPPPYPSAFDTHMQTDLSHVDHNASSHNTISIQELQPTQTHNSASQQVPLNGQVINLVPNDSNVCGLNVLNSASTTYIPASNNSALASASLPLATTANIATALPLTVPPGSRILLLTPAAGQSHPLANGSRVYTFSADGTSSVEGTNVEVLVVRSRSAATTTTTASTSVASSNINNVLTTGSFTDNQHVYVLNSDNSSVAANAVKGSFPSNFKLEQGIGPGTIFNSTEMQPDGTNLCVPPPTYQVKKEEYSIDSTTCANNSIVSKTFVGKNSRKNLINVERGLSYTTLTTPEYASLHSPNITTASSISSDLKINKPLSKSRHTTPYQRKTATQRSKSARKSSTGQNMLSGAGAEKSLAYVHEKSANYSRGSCQKFWNLNENADSDDELSEAQSENRSFPVDGIPRISLDELPYTHHLTKSQVEGLFMVLGPHYTNPGRRAPLKDFVLASLVLLSTKDSYREMSERMVFKSRGWMHKTIHQFCQMMVQHLSCVLEWPTGEDASEVCRYFQDSSRISGVIGVMDSCHVAISKAPVGKSSALYANNMEYNSIHLMGVCDHKYRFTYINVGRPGSLPLNKVFKQSSLCRIIEEDPKCLFPSNTLVVAPAGIPLKDQILTPYVETEINSSSEISRAHKAFNTQHSYVHRTVIKAFELLKARWQRVKCLEMQQVSSMSIAVKTCCILHNIGLSNSDYAANIDLDALVDASSHQFESSSLSRELVSTPSMTAVRRRDSMAAFLSASGVVW